MKSFARYFGGHSQRQADDGGALFIYLFIYLFIWGQGQQAYVGPFNVQVLKISQMLHTNTGTKTLRLRYNFTILLHMLTHWP